MATTATGLLDELRAAADPAEAERIRRHVPREGPDDRIVGVRMGTVFATAKAAVAMPLDEVSRLLDEPWYEARLAAVSVLDAQARRRLDDDARAERCALYLARHDRINTWDMVDRAAPHVVGRHLATRSRDPLRELAASPDLWRRRTAVTAPLYLVRFGGPEDLPDVLDLADRLAGDPEPHVTNAVGILLKHSGGVDPAAVAELLERRAADLPRPALRLAVDKLPAEVRRRFVAPRG